MTVKEILDNAFAISGQFVSEPMGIRYINNGVHALIHMFETAANVKKMDITVEGKIYELTDSLGVKRILRDGKPYKYYAIRENTIVFENDGDFTIHYLELPMDVESQYDEPDINEQYHPILELYVASRIQRPFDRELEQEFFGLAEHIDHRIKRSKLKNARMPARVWR